MSLKRMAGDHVHYKTKNINLYDIYVTLYLIFIYIICKKEFQFNI